ncbi:MAG: hypothetical protein ACTHZX_01565 [Microbacterium sp.]
MTMTTTTARRSEGAVRAGGWVSNTLRRPSTPAFIGLVAIWLAIGVLAGRGLWDTLSAGIIIATFLIVAGIGQLFVITVGNGGDRSLGSVHHDAERLSVVHGDGR